MIMEQCNNVEDWLVGLVWGRPTPDSGNTPRESRKSNPRSSRHQSQHTKSVSGQTRFANVPPLPPSPIVHSPVAGSFSNMSSEKAQVIKSAIAREEEGDKAYDPERDGIEAPHRPFYLTHAVCIACAMVCRSTKHDFDVSDSISRYSLLLWSWLVLRVSGFSR